MKTDAMNIQIKIKTKSNGKVIDQHKIKRIEKHNISWSKYEKKNST